MIKYKVRFKSQYDANYHWVEDIWDLQVDPISVAGVEFFSQETRSAKFGCFSDDWIRQHIIDARVHTYYKGYMRVQVSVYKDNELWLMGYLKTNGWERIQVSKSKQIFEMEFTIVDMLQVVKDFAEGMVKNLIRNEEYHTAPEIVSCLNAIIDENADFFQAQSAPAVYNEYVSNDWAVPYHFVNFPMFNRTDYDWRVDAVNNYDINTKTMKFQWNGTALELIYIDYKRRVISHLGSYPRLYQLKEYLKYGIYRLNGLKITRYWPVNLTGNNNLVPLPVERVKEAYFNSSGHLVRGGDSPDWVGYTVNQWLNAVTSLLVMYSCDTSAGLQNTQMQNGTTTAYYSIDAGKVLFTGFDVADLILIAEDREMDMIDWIRLLMKVLAAYIHTDGQALTVRNKVALNSTSITAIPDLVIGQPKIKDNEHRYSSFDVDLSVIQSGEYFSKAIDEYYQNMVKNELPKQMELIVDRYQKDVNVRWIYNGYLLYVLQADYDKINDQTNIKAMAKAL